MKGERFLPFRRSDVVEMCAQELPAADKERFLVVSRVLANLIHHRFHERIEALKDAYHPFQPAADTRVLRTLEPAAREAARARVEAELTGLAEAANFTPMSLAEVEEAMRQSSLLKLRLEIDTDDTDQVLLFRRGESQETRVEKLLFGLRKRTVTYTRYARVLVYAKFKEPEYFTPEEAAKLPYSPGSVIVKLFQNVPREDLEMIFPNVRIRMRPIDKLFIGVPAFVSGILVIANKLWAPILLVGGLLAFWFGIRRNEPPPVVNQAELVAVGLGLSALATYGFRQFNNFKNRKILFMKALSENLYYRNLDNDAGVFHHLLDAAEEAESIEAVLAYHFLRRAQTPLTVRELDAQVEQWFIEHYQTSFDFEVDDGVRKLRELGLVTAIGSGADERLAPLPPDAAARQLDRLWDESFTYAEPATVQQPAIAG